MLIWCYWKFWCEEVVYFLQNKGLEESSDAHWTQQIILVVLFIGYSIQVWGPHLCIVRLMLCHCWCNWTTLYLEHNEQRFQMRNNGQFNCILQSDFMFGITWSRWRSRSSLIRCQLCRYRLGLARPLYDRLLFVNSHWHPQLSLNLSSLRDGLRWRLAYISSPVYEFWDVFLLTGSHRFV